MQRRSGQLILLLYLVAKIFLTYKKPLNILHTTKRKFLSIIFHVEGHERCGWPKSRSNWPPDMDPPQVTMFDSA